MQVALLHLLAILWLIPTTWAASSKAATSAPPAADSTTQASQLSSPDPSAQAAELPSADPNAQLSSADPAAQAALSDPTGATGEPMDPTAAAGDPATLGAGPTDPSGGAAAAAAGEAQAPSAGQPTLVKGIDCSTLVPATTFQKAYKQGFTHLVLRGYFEAYGNNPGGAIEPTYSENRKNAAAAGYTNVDVTWWPCSGSTHQCKDYETQLAELVQFISQDDPQKAMPVSRIWLHIEVDPKANNWDYGPQGNLAEAQKMVAALQNLAGYGGIFSTPGMWKKIFGSSDVPLVSDLTNLALWYGTWDMKKTVAALDMSAPFGGWQVAVAKQYTNHSASKKFDLNIFVEIH